jgi:hypothetical protein
MALDGPPVCADHRRMFIRATSISLALLVVAALAGTAFATDSASPTLAPAPSDSSLQSVLNKCTDNTKPHSAISKQEAQTASRTRTLRGTARDTGCGVALVAVSVSQQHGKRCRFLTPTGRLGKLRKCTPSVWLSAAGAKKWRVPLDRLRGGTYRIRIRAVDFAGNIEHSHGRRLKLR